MKMFFKIVMFLVFFNLAAFFVAATGFFDEEATFYGDVFKDIDDRDLEDPDNLPNATTVMERILLNGLEEITIPVINFTLNWWAIIGGIIVFAIIVGYFTHSMAPIALGFVSSVFVLMFNNSQSMMLGITQNMHQVTQYIVLMIGVGVLIIIILTLMDYASGQASSG